jgi:membrane-bound inhibitor of C-type lysozyme
MKLQFVILAGSLILLAPHHAVADDAIASVRYACADDRAIEAIYFADKVEIALSDGREMTLPRTMSGSGIRYAEPDDAVVFWSKGKTAFVTEGDQDEPTFAGCTEAAQ